MRGPARRPTRGPRKRKPLMVKGLLRIGAGPAMLYHIAGTDKAVKLLREDVERLESDTRKHVEEMEEEELVRIMEQLDIPSIPLTDDEKQIVSLASKYVLFGYFLISSDEPTS